MRAVVARIHSAVLIMVSVGRNLPDLKMAHQKRTKTEKAGMEYDEPSRRAGKCSTWKMTDLVTRVMCLPGSVFEYERSPLSSLFYFFYSHNYDLFVLKHTQFDFDVILILVRCPLWTKIAFFCAQEFTSCITI